MVYNVNITQMNPTIKNRGRQEEKNMTSKAPVGGRTFFRTLIALLSSVLIMAAFSFVMIMHQNKISVQTHVDVLKMAMAGSAEQIDDFWKNSASFLLSLGEGDYLQKLAGQPEADLRIRDQAQREAIKRLAAFVSGLDCAQDAYIYIYNSDYLITASGVTEIEAYFNNRYTGDIEEFKQMLRRTHHFSLIRTPFEEKSGRREQYSASPLALMQTVYGSNGRAIGCFVVAVDGAALEQTAETYFTIPNTRALLLLGERPVTDAAEQMNISVESIPEGDYVRYISELGVVVRRRSGVISPLEYLAIDEESNIISERNQLLLSLEMIVALMTLAMGGIAFFAARQLYKPMKLLLSELDSPVTVRTDECRLLLQSIREAHEDYVSARHELDLSSPLVRDALMYHLLRGGKADERHLADWCLPALQPKAMLFYVFVLAISLPDDGDGSERRAVVERFERLFGAAALSILRTSDDEFSFVTTPLPRARYQELCQGAEKLCAALGGEKNGGVAVFASGGGVNSIENIAKAFYAARQCIRRRPITCEYAFLDAEDAPKGGIEGGVRLSPNAMAVYAALLSGGNPAKARAFVDDLLKMNRRPDVSVGQYIKLAEALNQQLFWTVQSSAPAQESRLIEIFAPHTLVTAEQLGDILRDNLAIFFDGQADAPDRAENSDMADVTRYVQENFAQNINLTSVAAHFGYSANYFSRYFKQKTGVNFIAYLNRVKIEEACRLLRAEEKFSVREIAKRCGYNSPQQFIATFEKLVGMTPGAFQKMQLSGTEAVEWPLDVQEE